ncbi:MAG: ComEC family competence protein [Candidatus Omnitrophica bacterium]|nr:ComEC family competence protein [Candidatus Omnitrophota bacterium]MBU4458181.1 ComEC family competence protein [Candidatus Omnitrophota bacterium]
MSKRPLAIIAILFISGIILASLFSDLIRFHYFFIAALIFIASSFIFCRNSKASNIFLFLSVVCFAATLYINSNTFSKDHVSQFVGEEKLRTDLSGVIKGPALKRRPYYGKINSTYLFDIETLKVEGERWRVKGLSQIRIQTEKDYSYGDRLLVTGTVKRPWGNSRFFNINTTEDNVTLLSRDYRANPILKHIYSFREKLKDQIIKGMPLESGSFLRAILLGDRSELPDHVQDSFKNSGTMHIFPIQNTKKLSYTPKSYITLCKSIS